MKKKLLVALVALLFISGSWAAKKVAFIDYTVNFGENSQSGISAALTTAGYEVTMIDVSKFTGGALDFTALDTYDLIVISKACNSSFFQNAVAPSWAALTKPVISLTPYMLRANRLNLLVSNLLLTWAAGTKTDLTTVTKAIPMVADASLTGVTIGLEPFEYFKGYYETLGEALDETTNSGKVIVTLNSDAILGAGLPLMIRWAAGATYAAGVTNAGPRTFLAIGSDDGVVGHNYNNYTTQSLKLFMNEVQKYAPMASGLKDIKSSNELVIVKNMSIELLQSVNQLDVYNSLGQLLVSKNNIQAGSTISLDKAGIYMIKTRVGNSLNAQKIVLN